MKRPLLLMLLTMLTLGGCPRRPPALVATPSVELDCGDAQDEDRDGLLDCTDPDCVAASVCLPDLVAVGLIGLERDAIVEVRPGAAITLGAQLRNDGAALPADPARPILVRVLASTSRLLEPTAITLREWRLVDGLAPAALVTLPPETLTLDLAPGTHFLLLVIEAGDRPEVLHTNNVAVVGQLQVVLVDDDRDGLPDQEELAIARAFAPDLLFHPDERCAEFDGVWSVRPIKAGVSVFYGLAYDKDCGLPLGAGTAAHLGDAEFLVVELLRDRDLGWEVVRVFLSAHFRSGDGKTALGAALLDHSNWFSGDAMTMSAGEAGEAHPRIVVARHKHAHYRDLRACRLTYDSCAEGRVQRFPVRAERNLGGSKHAMLPTIERGDRAEWFWRGPLPFCGWQVPSLVLSERKGCAGVQNSWFEQLTAWEEGRL